MRKIQLFLFFSFFWTLLIAQPFSGVDGMTFHSELEQKAFLKKEKKSFDEKLNLLLAVSPAISDNDVQKIKTTLDNFFKNQKFKMNSARTRRYPRQLEAAVRDSFLWRYEDYSGFDKLFKSGSFNDLTASALYGLVLDHFGMSYVIKMEEGRIFPLVFVEEQTVAIEISQNKTKHFNKQFIYQYLDFLREMKLINEGEFYKSKHEDLFQKYYKPDVDSLSHVQLVSMLYYKKALEAFKRSDYPTSIHAAEKAVALYNIPRHRAIRHAGLIQLANLANSINPESYLPLFELYYTSPGFMLTEEIFNQFLSLSERLLFQQNNEFRFNEYYHFFYDNLEEALMRQRLEELYLAQMAKYFASKKRFDKVLHYSDSIYQIKPNDEGIKKVITALLLEILEYENGYGQGLKLIENYRQKYPFIEKDEGIKDKILFYKAERIRYYFDRDKSARGLPYLEEFEKQLARFGKTPKVAYWVTTAYHAASSYYFRAQDYPASRMMVRRALGIAPDDKFLQHRLDLLSGY